MQIGISEVKALASGDTLSIHLPSGLAMQDTFKVVYKNGPGGDQSTLGPVPAGTTPNVRVSAPATISSNTNNEFVNVPWVAYAVGSSIIEIKVLGNVTVSGPGRLFVDFTKVRVSDTFDGDIKVNAFATGNGFTVATGIIIAKYSSSAKGTFAAVSSVKSMSTSATPIDTIMIQETFKNSIANSEQIKLKLPSGFKWDISAAAANGGWAFQGLAFGLSTSADNRTAIVTAPASGLGSLASEGRIFIGGLKVAVDDENIAKKGDVTVSVSGTNVTDQDLVVATYVDYGVTVEEKTVKEVSSGKWDTELGSFLISETIKDSLIPGRTIKLTLPEGVKWDVGISGTVGTANYAQAKDVITPTVQSGINFGNYNPVPGSPSSWSIDSSKRVLTLTLPNPIGSKSSVLFEKLKVVISPQFSGDIVLDVAGTAGATGQVKVATVKPVVEMTAADAPNVVIGMQSQAIADVTIVEGKKEAIDSAVGKQTLSLWLPSGATFANLPKVEVTDGDIAIDEVNYSQNKRAVDITIKSTSTKPATIKLSNMNVTVDRTLPEGDLYLSLDAANSTAVAESIYDRLGVKVFNIEDVAEVVVGKCITPAGTQGRSASFYIGSNIMNVNGVNTIMDVAPYIKAGRTYVPVRYLGDALGATTTWDAATKTVTVTKGDKTVILVIGSTIAKINGADVQMDVAPEIVNGRTMLPARWVAEGLGYAVGWNATLQQVVIQEQV